MIRKKVIAGNWKMNKTAGDGATLARDIVAEVGRGGKIQVQSSLRYTKCSVQVIYNSTVRSVNTTITDQLHHCEVFGTLDRLR
jgi:hypothetical protein